MATRIATEKAVAAKAEKKAEKSVKNTAAKKQAAASPARKQRASTAALPKQSTRARSARKTAEVTVEERQRMIEVAAYYRAAARGFQGGNATEDWLAAEWDVDQRLARSTTSAR